MIFGAFSAISMVFHEYLITNFVELPSPAVLGPGLFSIDPVLVYFFENFLKFSGKKSEIYSSSLKSKKYKLNSKLVQIN